MKWRARWKEISKLEGMKNVHGVLQGYGGEPTGSQWRKSNLPWRSRFQAPASLPLSSLCVGQRCSFTGILRHFSLLRTLDQGSICFTFLSSWVKGTELLCHPQEGGKEEASMGWRLLCGHCPTDLVPQGFCLHWFGVLPGHRGFQEILTHVSGWEPTDLV